MKKLRWKTEYSIAVMALFTVLLFIVPVSFNSKEANFISSWNEVYNKVDFMFTAIDAQAESDIVKGLKNPKNIEKRELMMIQLVKPYLRLKEKGKITKRYKTHYMNGNPVKEKDFYHFNNLFISDNNRIVGIKDVNSTAPNSPAFMILIDMNGKNGPNIWGRDIFGLDIYSDGEIKALGHDWTIEKMKKDCSKEGLGISCSYFYRIGGDFIE